MVDIQKDVIDLRKRILIVDDELFNRMSIKIILKAAGIKDIDEICDTANNGLEALNQIKDDANRNKSCSYGLILMD